MEFIAVQIVVLKVRFRCLRQIPLHRRELTLSANSGEKTMCCIAIFGDENGNVAPLVSV